MRDKTDTRTLDLFRHEPLRRMGIDYRAEYSAMVGGMLARHDRIKIAARMTEMLGQPVSRYMLDAWASPARVAHNIPAYAAPFLEVALDCRDLTDWSVGLHGGRGLYGEDAIQAVLDRELVALEISRAQAGRRIRDLRKRMGELE